jgi:transposase, IS5 family
MGFSQSIDRILCRIRERFDDLKIPFADYRRRAKRRMLGVINARNEKDRKLNYHDLLKMASNTVSYATEAASILERHASREMSLTTVEELRGIILLAERVIDQTTRRVINSESVPASEKIVSIFEPHADIIVKDRRETYYGHKICLSGGRPTS